MVKLRGIWEARCAIVWELLGALYPSRPQMNSLGEGLCGVRICTYEVHLGIG